MTDPDHDRQHDSDQPVSGIVPRTLDSAELLHGDKEVLIRHGSETYRLRLTRQGKLILQK